MEKKEKLTRTLESKVSGSGRRHSAQRARRAVLVMPCVLLPNARQPASFSFVSVSSSRRMLHRQSPS